MQYVEKIYQTFFWEMKRPLIVNELQCDLIHFKVTVNLPNKKSGSKRQKVKKGVFDNSDKKIKKNDD